MSLISSVARNAHLCYALEGLDTRCSSVTPTGRVAPGSFSLREGVRPAPLGAPPLRARGRRSSAGFRIPLRRNRPGVGFLPPLSMVADPDRHRLALGCRRHPLFAVRRLRRRLLLGQGRPCSRAISQSEILCASTAAARISRGSFSSALTHDPTTPCRGSWPTPSSRRSSSRRSPPAVPPWRTLLRSLKYEAVYLHDLADGFAAERVIAAWMTFYGYERPLSPWGTHVGRSLRRGGRREHPNAGA